MAIQPFFGRVTNEVAIAASKTSLSLIPQADEEDYGPFRYILARNGHSDRVLIIFDEKESKGVMLEAGEILELKGTISFRNIKVKELDGVEVTIDDMDINFSNILETTDLGDTPTQKTKGEFDPIFKTDLAL